MIDAIMNTKVVPLWNQCSSMNSDKTLLFVVSSLSLDQHFPFLEWELISGKCFITSTKCACSLKTDHGCFLLRNIHTCHIIPFDLNCIMRNCSMSVKQKICAITSSYKSYVNVCDPVVITKILRNISPIESASEEDELRELDIISLVSDSRPTSPPPLDNSSYPTLSSSSELTHSPKEKIPRGTRSSNSSSNSTGNRKKTTWIPIKLNSVDPFSRKVGPRMCGNCTVVEIDSTKPSNHIVCPQCFKKLAKRGKCKCGSISYALPGTQPMCYPCRNKSSL